MGLFDIDRKQLSSKWLPGAEMTVSVWDETCISSTAQTNQKQSSNTHHQHAPSIHANAVDIHSQPHETSEQDLPNNAAKAQQRSKLTGGQLSPSFRARSRPSSPLRVPGSDRRAPFPGWYHCPDLLGRQIVHFAQVFPEVGHLAVDSPAQCAPGGAGVYLLVVDERVPVEVAAAANFAAMRGVCEKRQIVSKLAGIVYASEGSRTWHICSRHRSWHFQTILIIGRGKKVRVLIFNPSEWSSAQNKGHMEGLCPKMGWSYSVPASIAKGVFAGIRNCWWGMKYLTCSP